jgi:uncharacterized protein YcfJ
MRKPSRLHPMAIALTLGGALLSTAAIAGPRVGEVVGTPSATSNTIQAKVVSSTPVVAQVALPTQVCWDEQQVAPPRSSGAGAVLGAIAGGAAGNAVGKGAGKALTTGIGIIGGAILGDHVENDGRPGTAYNARRCEQQTSYENRVVAYTVVYEFAGQRYSTQMGQEPGPTIPVQVTLTPLVNGPAAAQPYSGQAVQQPYAQPQIQPYYDDDRDTWQRRHRRWD